MSAYVKVKARPAATATRTGGPGEGTATRPTVRRGAVCARLVAAPRSTRSATATASVARDRSTARGLLGDRDETEVTIAPDEAVVPAERAENRYPDRCDRLSQHGLVAVGRDPVEHDGGQANRRVEGREAVDDGGDGAGHGLRVDDQEHRGVEEAGDVRGGRGRAVRSAVEQAHDPLDDQHVGALPGTGGEWSDGGGAAEPGIEVARRSAAGEGVVAGVDEVGADLGGGGAVPRGPERGQEAGRHRGLADSRVGTGDDEPGSENRHDAGR